MKNYTLIIKYLNKKEYRLIQRLYSISVIQEESISKVAEFKNKFRKYRRILIAHNYSNRFLPNDSRIKK